MTQHRGEVEGLTELAVRIRELSRARWGSANETTIVGLHDRMLAAQHRMLLCAQADSPVLIAGETGTGKELFARALHVLSRRRAAPYLCVNCAQYHDGNLVASELFGHRKGSYTGAVADRRGIFEEADGGVLFLDEIAELSPVAQAMLLRALSEGEVVPVGDSRPRHVNVRVFAATGRDLRAMVARGLFREDLYYRLHYLQVKVPALRDRGDDRVLLANHYLRAIAERTKSMKTLSAGAVELVRRYDWPGNVRELRSVIETAYHVSVGAVIEAADIAGELEGGPAAEDARPPAAREHPAAPAAPIAPAASGPPVRRGAPGAAAPDEVRAHGDLALLTLYNAIVVERANFWEMVYEPFMARDLSRSDARALIERGLIETRGSYKRLVALFGIDGGDYLRFMDFLRHHRLKPPRPDEPTSDGSPHLSRGSQERNAMLSD